MSNPQDLRPGDPREVGGFKLEGFLGFGGHGDVFLGQRDGQLAAVKLLKDDITRDKVLRQALERELKNLRALSSVSNVHVPRLLDADLGAPRPYVAMEYLAGPTLEERVVIAPLEGDALWELAAKLASTLAVFAAASHIHRDLKPRNIIMTLSGPRVVDFGIGRMLEATQITIDSPSIGSPPWMAPEALRGIGATPATDVYAYGLILVFAATGRSPQRNGVRPSRAGLSPRLAKIAALCLQTDPDRRPNADRILQLVMKPDAMSPVSDAILDATEPQQVQAVTKSVTKSLTQRTPPSQRDTEFVGKERDATNASAAEGSKLRRSWIEEQGGGFPRTLCVAGITVLLAGLALHPFMQHHPTNWPEVGVVFGGILLGNGIRRSRSAMVRAIGLVVVGLLFVAGGLVLRRYLIAGGHQVNVVDAVPFLGVAVGSETLVRRDDKSFKWHFWPVVLGVVLGLVDNETRLLR